MRFKIPFLPYEVHINKRGLKWVKNGELVSFVDWVQGITFSQSTPILEQIYDTIASEYAKLDYMHIIDKNGDYRTVKDELDYIISERPNPLQTKYDFFYTMIYQLYKYGNALAFIHRDEKGNCISLEPLNVNDYMLGSGYQFENGVVLIKYLNVLTNEQMFVDYKNIIHLRLNPNDVFYGDLYSGADNTKMFTQIIDKSLNSLIAELSQSGTVRGIIKVGNAGIGYSNGFANRAMMNQDAKIEKQDEIVERIKKNQGSGILVLDAGEEWQSLNSPFTSITTDQLDKYIDLLFQFYGVSKKVINGEATAEQMEIFFNKTIAPKVDQCLAEMNYKIFKKTSRTQGHRIEYFRNAFEYLPLDKAIDTAYKGIQDTTTNERRKLIYHLPPIEGGDEVMRNKNFEPLDALVDYYHNQTGGNSNDTDS